jgi:hypothetical protein
VTTLKINNKKIEIPGSLAEFTLGRRLKFQELHGDLLDMMTDSILKMEDGIEKDLELLDFHFERMFRIFSFFTGVTVEACRASEIVDRIAYIYNAHLSYLFDDPKDPELIGAYTFKGERWTLPEPILKQGGDLSFGEVIDSKQMIRDTFALNQGRWAAVLKLAAIYLRREGESYEEEFLFDDSPRIRLMMDLPMSIAHQVYFFLINLIPSSPVISIFSGKAEQRERDRISVATMTFMGGSISSNLLQRPRFLTSPGAALIPLIAPAGPGLSMS